MGLKTSAQCCSLVCALCYMQSVNSAICSVKHGYTALNRLHVDPTHPSSLNCLDSHSLVEW